MNNLKHTFILLALYFFLPSGNAQDTTPLVILDDHFEEINSDSVITYWKVLPQEIPLKISVVLDTLRAHQFRRFDNTNDQLGSKIRRSQYDYWIAVQFQNKSDIDIGILISAHHGPKIAFHSLNKYETPIPGMSGVAAQYDPNQLITLRTRDAFTFNVKKQSIDTVLFKIHDASMYNKFGTHIFEVRYYDKKLNASLNTPTILNGLFLGFMFALLLAAGYFYFLMRQPFVQWYILYILLLIIYFWRDFETWNNYFNFSHTYLSWDDTKVALGYLIFLCYNYFMTDILDLSGRYPLIKKWLHWATIAFPVIMLLDILSRIYFPFGSYILMYSAGYIGGMVQISFLIPLFMSKNKVERLLKIIALGSIILFLGWLSIPLLSTPLHRVVVRISTLIELTIFMLAMVERSIIIFRKQQSEIIEKEYTLRSERDRIASEMHDDLGGSLTTIKYLTLQGQSDRYAKDPKEIFSKIGEMSNDITNKISEIVWVLNEKNETLEQLIYYLRSKINDQLSLHQIAFEFKLDITQPKIEFRSEFRRDIILCISEGINNIIKHANSSQVSMSIREDSTNLLVSIADNGKTPLEVINQNNGHGLNNLKKRIRRWNGSVEWKLINGTEIIFVVPLSKIGNPRLTKVI